MKLTYDPRQNIAYLTLREAEVGVEVETKELGPFANVDLAPDGTVYGIELLNANEQLALKTEAGRLTVVNEADGATAEIRLPA